MPNVNRDQVLDCATPLLDVFFKINGSPSDMYEVKWRIFDKTSGSPVQVEPPSGFNTVNQDLCPAGDRLGVGHYHANWTVPSAASFGLWEVEWRYKLLSASAEECFKEEFDVLPIAVASTGNAYCTVEKARCEGISEALIDDEKLAHLLEQNSRILERMTGGRWFNPRPMTIRVDGSGTKLQQIGPEIIEITKVEIEHFGYFEQFEEIPVEDLIIYNRHVRDGLLLPDDRQNPKIEFNMNGRFMRLFGMSAFPKGSQNIKITGTFGYTDYDGSATGVTPMGICRLCLLLTAENLNHTITGAGGLCSDPREHLITSKKTRDRTVTYDLNRETFGNWYGDRAEINRLVELYKKSNWMGAV